MPDTFNFSDVFISYSRRDKDFARRLFDRLKAENREVWADWEDIPATADWWAEVQAGIEGANTFIFVISPDSVISDVCRREIDHAMKSNKRFVPVLYREVVEPDHKDRVHGAISSHNWIYFRDTDDFETAYQRLIASLETDLNHVRLHTRYLVRAREWDSRQRIPGFLLAGTELKDGQQWLMQNAKLEPNPTPLHHEYINASAQARRRQQMLQIGLIAGLVVSIAMAILAFSQSQEAARQAALANANANIAVTNAEDARFQAGTAQAAGATSDANAIIAQNAADANATAQAIAVNYFEDAQTQAALAVYNADQASTQAALALDSAVTATVAQGEAVNQAGTAIAAQSTSDANAVIAAQQAATAEYSDGVSRSIALAAQSQLDINGSSPERAIRLALDAVLFLPYTQQAERALGIAVQNSRVGDVYIEEGRAIKSIAFSSDGKLMITGADDGTALVFDIDAGEVVLTLEGHSAAVEDAVWSPDGRYIATASDDYTAVLWDAQSGEMLRTLVGHSYWVRRVAFSPDSRFLVTASDDSTAIIWDAATGSALHVLQGHLDRVTDAVFSPDGKTVATASWDTSVIFWDTASGRQLRRWGGDNAPNGHTQVIQRIAYSPDGRYLLTAGDDARAMLWNVATGEQVGPPLAARDRILAAQWSADGKEILTASNDGTIQIWVPIQAPDAPANAYNVALQFSAGVIKDATFSPHTGEVVTAGADGKVKFWDTTVDRARLTLDDNTVALAVFSPDGTRIMTAGDHDLHFWDAETGDAISLSWSLGEWQINYVAVFSPDGTRIAVDISDQKTLVSGTDGTWLTLDGVYPAWSPDGRYIATAVSENIAIWDANTGEQVNMLIGDTVQVYSLSWSPDSQYLVSGTADPDAIIWDVSTGEQLFVLAGHSETITSVAWSPDGTRIATASSDGTARVWDAKTGQSLIVLSGHTGPLESVDWSPNGARLITASRDRTARAWDAASGTEMVTLFDGQTGALIYADWSPDGTQVVTTSDTGQVQVWAIWQTLDDLITYANQCCYIPDLTPQEKQQFGLTNIPGA